MERYSTERCRSGVPRPVLLRYGAEAEQLATAPEVRLLLDDCSAAMAQMPVGRIGLVIGAGGHVERWRKSV